MRVECGCAHLGGGAGGLCDALLPSQLHNLRLRPCLPLRNRHRIPQAETPRQQALALLVPGLGADVDQAERAGGALGPAAEGAGDGAAGMRAPRVRRAERHLKRKRFALSKITWLEVSWQVSAIDRTSASWALACTTCSALCAQNGSTHKQHAHRRIGADSAHDKSVVVRT